MLEIAAPAEEQQHTRESEQRVIGRPFPPGVSGNPNGRPPKGQTMGDRLRAELSKARHDGATVPRTNAEAVAEAAVKLALSGEPHAVRAIEFIYDRLDGKVSQPIEVSNVLLVMPQDDYDALP